MIDQQQAGTISRTVPDAVLADGYLLDTAGGRRAVLTALTAARARGAVCALTLADPRIASTFRHFINFLDREGLLDIVYANLDEIVEYMDGSDPVSARYPFPVNFEAAVTLGAEGAAHVSASDGFLVPPGEPERVHDTTGAGDAFAAGHLYARLAGRGERDALRLGCDCAAAVIAETGARPEVPLRHLLG